MQFLWWIAALWCAYLVYDASTSETVLLKGLNRASKQDSPIAYWFWTVFYAIAGVLFCVLPFISDS